MKYCASPECPVFKSGNYPNATCKTCKANKDDDDKADEVEYIKNMMGMKEKK